jgi:hypothetical protein
VFTSKLLSALAAGFAVLALLPAVAAAEPKLYECQKPVITGVEVYGLHGVGTARACPVALALHKWENSSASHANALYGCRFPKPNAAGYPYLRLRSFRGWKLSLVGRPYGSFTMSMGRSSFHVGGTDFPLNCT